MKIVLWLLKECRDEKDEKTQRQKKEIKQREQRKYSVMSCVKLKDYILCLFCLSFGDFTQLQKLMWGIKNVQTLAINLLTSLDPSQCQ